MKISVVMATYQGEKYLREQLDTIRLQTRRADEVILCDDCSGDATVEIAEQYIREYGLEAEWRILVNEKNLGYANNFHRAGIPCQLGNICFLPTKMIYGSRKKLKKWWV